MALAFKTPDDYPSSVEISNGGLLGPFGTAPLSLEVAATRMPALQRPVGTPLTGDELKEAAKAWIGASDNIELANLKADKLTIDPDKVTPAQADAEIPPAVAETTPLPDEAAVAAEDSDASDSGAANNTTSKETRA